MERQIRLIGSNVDGDDSYFSTPTGITINQERREIFILDSRSSSIRVFSSKSLAFIRKFDHIKKKNEVGVTKFGISSCIDNLGRLFVVDPWVHKVFVMTSATGDFISSFGEKGHLPGQFETPYAICYCKMLNSLFVADFDNNRVQEFDAETFAYKRSIGKGRGSKESEFRGPSHVALDEITNRIFVADFSNNRIQIFDIESGNLIGCINQLKEHHCNFPRALFVFKNYLLVSSRDSAKVIVFDKFFFTLVAVFGEKRGNLPGEFMNPFEICVDEESGCLFVTDSQNGRIQVIEVNEFKSKKKGQFSKKSPKTELAEIRGSFRKNIYEFHIPNDTILSRIKFVNPSSRCLGYCIDKCSRNISDMKPFSNGVAVNMFLSAETSPEPYLNKQAEIFIALIIESFKTNKTIASIFPSIMGLHTLLRFGWAPQFSSAALAEPLVYFLFNLLDSNVKQQHLSTFYDLTSDILKVVSCSSIEVAQHVYEITVLFLRNILGANVGRSEFISLEALQDCFQILSIILGYLEHGCGIVDSFPITSDESSSTENLISLFLGNHVLNVVKNGEKVIQTSILAVNSEMFDILILVMKRKLYDLKNISWESIFDINISLLDRVQSFFQKTRSLHDVVWKSLAESREGRKIWQGFEKFEVGMLIDCLDKENMWYEACITAVHHDGSIGVHYLGWGSKWDDIIPPHSFSRYISTLNSQTICWREDLFPGSLVEIKCSDDSINQKWMWGKIVDLNHEERWVDVSFGSPLQVPIIRRVGMFSEDICPIGVHTNNKSFPQTLTIFQPVDLVHRLMKEKQMMMYGKLESYLQDLPLNGRFANPFADVAYFALKTIFLEVLDAIETVALASCDALISSLEDRNSSSISHVEHLSFTAAKIVMLTLYITNFKPLLSHFFILPYFQRCRNRILVFSEVLKAQNPLSSCEQKIQYCWDILDQNEVMMKSYGREFRSCVGKVLGEDMIVSIIEIEQQKSKNLLVVLFSEIINEEWNENDCSWKEFMKSMINDNSSFGRNKEWLRFVKLLGYIRNDEQLEYFRLILLCIAQENAFQICHSYNNMLMSSVDFVHCCNDLMKWRLEYLSCCEQSGFVGLMERAIDRSLEDAIKKLEDPFLIQIGFHMAHCISCCCSVAQNNCQKGSNYSVVLSDILWLFHRFLSSKFLAYFMKYYEPLLAWRLLFRQQDFLQTEQQFLEFVPFSSRARGMIRDLEISKVFSQSIKTTSCRLSSHSIEVNIRFCSYSNWNSIFQWTHAERMTLPTCLEATASHLRISLDRERLKMQSPLRSKTVYLYFGYGEMVLRLVDRDNTMDILCSDIQAAILLLMSKVKRYSLELEWLCRELRASEDVILTNISFLCDFHCNFFHWDVLTHQFSFYFHKCFNGMKVLDIRPTVDILNPRVQSVTVMDDVVDAQIVRLLKISGMKMRVDEISNTLKKTMSEECLNCSYLNTRCQYLVSLSIIEEEVTFEAFGVTITRYSYLKRTSLDSDCESWKRNAQWGEPMSKISEESFPHDMICKEANITEVDSLNANSLFHQFVSAVCQELNSHMNPLISSRCRENNSINKSEISSQSLCELCHLDAALANRCFQTVLEVILVNSSRPEQTREDSNDDRGADNESKSPREELSASLSDRVEVNRQMDSLHHRKDLLPWNERTTFEEKLECLVEMIARDRQVDISSFSIDYGALISKIKSIIQDYLESKYEPLILSNVSNEDLISLSVLIGCSLDQRKKSWNSIVVEDMIYQIRKAHDILSHFSIVDILIALTYFNWNLQVFLDSEFSRCCDNVFQSMISEYQLSRCPICGKDDTAIFGICNDHLGCQECWIKHINVHLSQSVFVLPCCIGQQSQECSRFINLKLLHKCYADQDLVDICQSIFREAINKQSSRIITHEFDMPLSCCLLPLDCRHSQFENLWTIAIDQFILECENKRLSLCDNRGLISKDINQVSYQSLLCFIWLYLRDFLVEIKLIGMLNQSSLIRLKSFIHLEVFPCCSRLIWDLNMQTSNVLEGLNNFILQRNPIDFLQAKLVMLRDYVQQTIVHCSVARAVEWKLVFNPWFHSSQLVLDSQYCNQVFSVFDALSDVNEPFDAIQCQFCHQLMRILPQVIGTRGGKSLSECSFSCRKSFPEILLRFFLSPHANKDAVVEGLKSLQSLVGQDRHFAALFLQSEFIADRFQLRNRDSLVPWIDLFMLASFHASDKHELIINFMGTTDEKIGEMLSDIFEYLATILLYRNRMIYNDALTTILSCIQSLAIKFPNMRCWFSLVSKMVSFLVLTDAFSFPDCIDMLTAIWRESLMNITTAEECDFLLTFAMEHICSLSREILEKNKRNVTSAIVLLIENICIRQEKWDRLVHQVLDLVAISDADSLSFGDEFDKLVKDLI